jgi:hypothetical protein
MPAQYGAIRVEIVARTTPLWSSACRLLKNDASPAVRDRQVREKDAGSANSSAICATEDVLSRRLVRFGGRGFVFQQPTKLLTDNRTGPVHTAGSGETTSCLTTETPRIASDEEAPLASAQKSDPITPYVEPDPMFILSGRIAENPP